jgi:hypothetical protein
MYANAEQALVGLRHANKPTGKLYETKIVARNTKLVYFADDLVGLKLHDTVIALYRPDGVSIDLRGPGSPNGHGWFTAVTLDRIDRFTPVRTIRQRGLTMIVANPSYGGRDWTEGARLYAHGCSRSCNGSFTNGLEPAIEAAILRVHNTFDRKAKNFAKRCVNYWRRGGEPLPCCQGDDGDTNAHLISHIERNEVCIPWRLDNLFMQGKQMGLIGDTLAEQMTMQLASDLRELREDAIHTIEPNFPYPQPNRTGGY